MLSELAENVLGGYAAMTCFFLFSAGCTLIGTKKYSSAAISFILSLIGTGFLVLWVLSP